MWLLAPQVLYSYDRKHSGMLSHEELRSAMDRINLGLSEEEKGRVLVRLDPQGQGSVTADDFLAAFDILKPLGEQMSVEQMHACELQNNVQTLRPWDSRRGEMRAWKRPERAVMGMANNAEAGSHEQQKEDLFLLSLIRGKLVQHKDRLRMMFRNADANHNSLVDKDAFVAGLASLRMNVGWGVGAAVLVEADRGSRQRQTDEYALGLCLTDAMLHCLACVPRRLHDLRSSACLSWRTATAAAALTMRQVLQQRVGVSTLDLN